MITDRIHEFYQSEIKALESFKEDGGLVAGMFCRFFPVSLLAGLGIWPMRLLRGATENAVQSGEKIVRPDVCPYCKSIIGNFHAGNSFHASCDFIVGIITCDMMRRTLERLEIDIGKPVFPVQLPATTSDAAAEYYILNVENALKGILSFIDKTEIDYQVVRSDAALRVETARILEQMIWQGNVSPEIMHALLHGYVWARPEKYLSFLKELQPEIPAYKPSTTVLLVGSVVCDEDKTVVDILTEQNVQLVPLNCTGISMLQGMEPVNDVPDDQIVRSLCRNVFTMPSCIRSRPNTSVYDKIGEALTKSNAQGIILKSLSFCDLWYTEKERIKETFNVPVLVLDTGYGAGADERVITRLETFLETLQ